MAGALLVQQLENRALINVLHSFKHSQSPSSARHTRTLAYITGRRFPTACFLKTKCPLSANANLNPALETNSRESSASTTRAWLASSKAESILHGKNQCGNSPFQWEKQRNADFGAGPVARDNGRLSLPLSWSLRVKSLCTEAGDAGSAYSEKGRENPEKWDGGREKAAWRESKQIDGAQQDELPGGMNGLGPMGETEHSHTKSSQGHDTVEGLMQGSGLDSQDDWEENSPNGIRSNDVNITNPRDPRPHSLLQYQQRLPSVKEHPEFSISLPVREVLAPSPRVQGHGLPNSGVQSQERSQNRQTSRRPKTLRLPKGAKPLCYHFTQGLCKHGDKMAHLEKYSHVFPDLPIRPSDLARVRPQPFDYFLVLDLEGREEILEFPVVMLDAKSLQPVDRFHRFVRPVLMTMERQDSYVRGKYGPWELDRVWDATAIPFTSVVEQFEKWMEGHGLWEPGQTGPLQRAAFVTCGNWDVKTKIPEQCVDSKIELQPYFKEWVNLKDVYYSHYNRKPSGMRYMLRELKIPLRGAHHLGLDDAHNIARVLQRMLVHRAVVKITARRTGPNPADVEWTFRRRVK